MVARFWVALAPLFMITTANAVAVYGPPTLGGGTKTVGGGICNTGCPGGVVNVTTVLSNFFGDVAASEFRLLTAAPVSPPGSPIQTAYESSGFDSIGLTFTGHVIGTLQAEAWKGLSLASVDASAFGTATWEAPLGAMHFDLVPFNAAGRINLPGFVLNGVGDATASHDVALDFTAAVTGSGGSFKSFGEVYVYQSVTTEPAPIPEPASWALMLIGAIVIGATRRRSR